MSDTNKNAALALQMTVGLALASAENVAKHATADQEEKLGELIKKREAAEKVLSQTGSKLRTIAAEVHGAYVESQKASNEETDAAPVEEEEEIADLTSEIDDEETE